MAKGDLISRSALLQEFETENVAHNSDLWHISGIKAFIENEPTAYNLDAVVEELEKLKQHNKDLSEGAYLEDDKSFYFCAYTNFARAIGIVRKGGVNNENRN